MTLKSNKNLVKSIFSYTSAMVISQALVAVYTLILIWWLNTEQYGYFSANYAAVMLTSFIISLGLHEWLIRTIPLENNSKTLTGGVLVYKLLIGLIWGFGLIFILPNIKPNIFYRQLLIIIILDIWFESAFYLLLADLLGHGKVVVTSSLLVSSRVLRLISLLIVILFNSQSLVYIVFLKMVSTVIIFFITFVISKPDISHLKEFNVLKILKSSIVFNAAEILNLIFLQIDLNLFSIINGNPVLVGNFAIAISIINMIMTFPIGIASMILPNTVQSYQQSPKQHNKKMISIGLGFLFFGLLLWTIISILRVETINNLLNENYRNVISILLSISPILFIRTLNQFNRIYLISVKWERKQLFPYAIAILVKLILGIFALQNFALEGLVLLSIISDVLLLLGFSIQMLRHQFKFRSSSTQ